ncbi:hypothetical protein GPECTOR_10g852 [Gonium pectorale]|uniref:Uncharacterized protein n=1 Tax=Gonium pectorale TaxID=33097 RepID=A0A150GQY8_GONPE|nr:hypothetical protein GPECTOR_10g852 [Gonium pectorale]|eukprot:KXZ52221.1 hypothetical protein GPECTOR_10g852 [Gonium pectorale]
MAIDLYATEAPLARYTSEPGMRRVGEMTLELPPGWAAKVANRYEYSVEIELCFGSTEITLLARDVQSRNVVAAKVAWTADPVFLPAA